MPKKTIAEAQKDVPEYINPRKCFITLKNTAEGYMSLGPHGCAHYVAHQKEIKISEEISSNRCYENYAIQVKQVIVGQPKRDHIDQVRVGDIWAKKDHCGIVSSVKGGNPPTIYITHCSGALQEFTTTEYGSVAANENGSEDITGGKFYGSLSSTNWLGNNHKREVHNLSKEKANCQIGKIKPVHRVYFSSKEEALNYKYDPCAYCIPGESTR
jgi:hypothetical protein